MAVDFAEQIGGARDSAFIDCYHDGQRMLPPHHDGRHGLVDPFSPPFITPFRRKRLQVDSPQARSREQANRHEWGRVITPIRICSVFGPDLRL